MARSLARSSSALIVEVDCHSTCTRQSCGQGLVWTKAQTAPRLRHLHAHTTFSSIQCAGDDVGFVPQEIASFLLIHPVAPFGQTLCGEVVRGSRLDQCEFSCIALNE